MRRRWSVGAVSVVAVLVGCSGSPKPKKSAGSEGSDGVQQPATESRQAPAAAPTGESASATSWVVSDPGRGTCRWPPIRIDTETFRKLSAPVCHRHGPGSYLLRLKVVGMQLNDAKAFRLGEDGKEIPVAVFMPRGLATTGGTGSCDFAHVFSCGDDVE